VKRFEFRLERVRQWRQSELEAEQARLEGLLRALRELETELLRLRSLLEEAEREVVRSAEAGEPLHPPLLAAIAGYRQYMRGREQLIAGRMADLREQIAQQRGRVAEAWKRWELLNRLRERAWAHWQAEWDKELERQANELSILRWGARQQRQRESAS